MALNKQEIIRLLNAHEIKGYTIYDANGKEIKLGDEIYNSKTDTTNIVDEKVIKTLDFNIEMGIKSTIFTLVDEKLEKEKGLRHIELDSEEDEEDEEECLECEMPVVSNNDDTLNVSNIKKLEKEFDEVQIEIFDEYQILSIRDRVHNTNAARGIDWIIWFEIKIRTIDDDYGYSKTNKKPNKFANMALKDLTTWLELIIKHKQTKQATLFDDKNEPSEESESATVRTGSVPKHIAIKKYEFLDLVDFSSEYYSVGSSDLMEIFRKSLPKSDKEIRDKMKNLLMELTKDNRTLYGNFKEFSWRNEYKTFKIGDTLSDVEIADRFYSTMSLNIGIVKNYKRCFTDDTGTVFESYNKKTYSSVATTDGHGCVCFNTMRKSSGIMFSLIDDEMISWLREWFDIKKKDSIVNDDDAVRMAIEQYYNDISKEVDLVKEIKSSLSYEEYKKRFSSIVQKKDFKKDSGYGYTMEDGYLINVSFASGKNDNVSVGQWNRVRRLSDKNIDTDDVSTGIEKLEGIENINKRAFELFCDREAIRAEANKGQGSLF